MNQVAGTVAIYFGTRYVVNYVLNRATDKVITSSWNVSKRVANAAIDRIIVRDEEPIDYLEYELLEKDSVDPSIIRVINIIELPIDEYYGAESEVFDTVPPVYYPSLSNSNGRLEYD
jgi:hypothetical protein